MKNENDQTSPELSQTNSRRDFLVNAGKLAAWAATAPLVNLATEKEMTQLQLPTTDKINGIQIGAVSFADEGVENVLETVQKRAVVNTLYLTTFTYGRGLGGRQIPGQPFPDHGSQESDDKTYSGGNYAQPHPEYYRDTVLKGLRTKDHGKFDILGDVIPAAKKRGIKVFASVEDSWRAGVPGLSDVAEVDLQGNKTNTQCLFNPDVRNFWTGLVKDICKSYDVDGILFFNERNGPLLNALGASHSQNIASSRVTCFCEYHQRAAKEKGIDFQRTKIGFQKLNELVQASLNSIRPGDGYYVAFERLLIQYPEIIAWDRLFDSGKHQVLEQVNASVKSINKNLKVGFHIEHVNSFNPFFRATRSYEELGSKADFLKVVAYNNCGGERYANFIRNIGSTIFKDVPLEELLQFNNHLLGYGNEASLEQLPETGLSSDYVFRETKRALIGVQGKAKILTGIDVGIPTGEKSRKSSPENVYAATLAAYKAGANGVILSRKYSEMMLAELDAAGRAINEAAKLNS